MSIPERSSDGGHERAGQRLVAGSLGYRMRFPRQERLVDLEPVGREDHAVDDDLRPRRRVEHVVQHHITDRDLPHGAVAHHARLRCRQDAEAVERSLRAELLHDPDRGVRHQDESEQRILDRPHDQDQHQHPAEQGVEPRQDVRANDLRDGPSRNGRHVVDRASAHTLIDLIGRETSSGIDDGALVHVHGRSLRSVRARPSRDHVAMPRTAAHASNSANASSSGITPRSIRNSIRYSRASPTTEPGARSSRAIT